MGGLEAHFNSTAYNSCSNRYERYIARIGRQSLQPASRKRRLPPPAIVEQKRLAVWVYRKVLICCCSALAEERFLGCPRKQERYIPKPIVREGW